MIRRIPFIAMAALLLLVLAAPATAAAAEGECSLVPRTACFELESAQASLSTLQAGGHPDLGLTFDVAKDPKSKANVFGLKDSYDATRHVRFELPPGLIGDPNVLGIPQQCTVQELVTWNEPDGGCPNGSQVGLSHVFVYDLIRDFTEPLYMMQPPAGDVVARLGLVAGIFPTFIDFTVRSESDYGITAEIRNATAAGRLIKAETVTWGVPAAESHDDERCTVDEVFSQGCVSSEPRPPGSRPLPFLTNPTRCGLPLILNVGAASWSEPNRFSTIEVGFPSIVGCDRLPFGPGLTIEPTNHRAGTPTGLDITARLPASDGVEVLEPAQTRDLRVALPKGLTVNPGSAEGLETCSTEQVHFGERVAAECPDAAKMAGAEFDIPALPRRMKGAVYLREPEPGNLFRFWVVADDLGAHVKLPGQLNVDEGTGQVESVMLDLPQAPLREAKLLFKSGFRAPLLNPKECGTYLSHYEFTPWSGGSPVSGTSQMEITEGCDGGGFSPKLSAGSINAQGGAYSPFTFTLNREDSEQNLAGLDVTLPRGMAASFVGIARCEGADVEAGTCPAASRIGKTVVADGVGPNPLWVPQPGKDPTAVYLGGPYQGAPFSIVAVVPAQAGPFDLGLEVVRSAVFVDPATAQATAKADPLPQFIEGIPIIYKTVNVQLDRPGFSLNPTSCALKEARADLTSTGGKNASPTASYAATGCSDLGFKPRLSLRLRGGTKRGAHPSLRAVFRPRPGDANVGAFSVALPHSEFLDQGHIGTVCTRVQFRADECPAASIYGTAKAISPLFDFPVEGPLYLRSSNNPLPDMVAALKGPASFPIEVEAVGRIDSVNGGIRTTFDFVPDAPVSEIVASFPGGNKGLIVNSTNLCKQANRVTAKFIGQNGKKATLRPALQNSCKKAKKHKRQR